MTVPEVLDAFNAYIQKEIPFRLIDLDTMQLVDVGAVEQTYLPIIESIVEEDIERHTSYANQRRENVITAIVKGIVKYAVLSHTWSRKQDEQEFVYHAMVSDFPRTTPGWRKLESFCDIARRLFKCRFAWTDTVCLDYGCQADGQLACESKFHWFRNAYVCIVYLEGSSTVEDLDRDIWFRRGWTLGELLAPIRMKFYGAGWRALNNKFIDNDKADGTFLKSLSSVSGIPIEDLRSFWPGPDRIRLKLSWASRRQTLVDEDKAYALMAIFDTPIQVQYGEGEEAFKRLMFEVIPRSGECDIFAWAGPRSPYHPGLPPSPAGYGTQHHDQQLNPMPHHYRLCGDRALSIDSDYLRIRVILIPVSVPKAWMSSYRPVPQTHSASVSEASEALHIGPPYWTTQTATDGQMAVGVIDYGWADSADEGILHEGDKYFCFLLYRSSGGEWRKVDTEKVVYLTSGQEVIQKLETLCLQHDHFTA